MRGVAEKHPYEEWFEVFGDDPSAGWSPLHRTTRDLEVFREADRLTMLAAVGKVCHHHVPPTGDAWDPGFDVGPSGALTPRGLDLAVNVLTAYAPPGEDGGEPVECRYRNVMSATAAELHEAFAREVLAFMSDDGGRMAYSDLMDWIEERRPGTQAALDSMFGR
jgi:hypothetical protein